MQNPSRKGPRQRRSPNHAPPLGEAPHKCGAEGGTRSALWFDKLTILSKVEGRATPLKRGDELVDIMPDEEIPEWEIKDEEPHESLKRKWAEEERVEKQMVPCPQCGKLITSDAFNCIYCGATVFKNSGFIGTVTHFILGWGGGIIFAVVFIMILVFFVL
ncbi:MAG: zinc ribbon domain-containing protein [Candidatus Omnitrophica bacterium]|nr:zinc ribbon domain-containing protein [Candidatus Omnitrophota bacterium]